MAMHVALQVTGSITYNGHNFSEFIPERTASYIDQTDTHLAELTVRETFDFAARCQGTGHKAGQASQGVNACWSMQHVWWRLNTTRRRTYLKDTCTLNLKQLHHQSRAQFMSRWLYSGPSPIQIQTPLIVCRLMCNTK